LQGDEAVQFADGHPAHVAHQPAAAGGMANMAGMGGMAGMPGMQGMADVAGIGMSTRPFAAILEAARKGLWELVPCPAPLLAIYGAVLHTGKVLLFAGSGNDELFTTGWPGGCN
jgi:hypothetical protein